MVEIASCCVTLIVTLTEKPDRHLFKFINKNLINRWIGENTRGESSLDLIFTFEENTVIFRHWWEVRKQQPQDRKFYYQVYIFNQWETLHSEVILFGVHSFYFMHTALEQIEGLTGKNLDENWGLFKDNCTQTQSTFIPMWIANIEKNLKPKWLDWEIKNAVRKKKNFLQRSKSLYKLWGIVTILNNN